MASEPKTPQASRLRHLADFFGLKRSILGLLSMVILVGMGEKMAERFLPLYLIALGAGLRWPGYLNGLDNLLSALYSFPGGYLSHRLGVKRALLIFNIIAMVGFLIVILIPAKEAVLGASLLFLSWTAISLPATMGLVAKVLPKNKRVMGVTVHSLVRRIPMALGPLAGGMFIVTWGERDGVRLAFVAALAMALMAAVMQQILIEDDEQSTGNSSPPQAEKNPLRVLREMSPQLRNLLVSDILIRFCEQIPYAYVVIWCVKTVGSGVNAFDFGILTTIEMATAMLVYIPVAYLADRTTKKPFVVMTFIFFTFFPLALLYSHSFWPLAAAFVLRGFKEFGEPTRKALIMDLAPEDKKAAMFGTYYLFRDVVVSASAFAGAFLWEMGPQVNFLTAFACGVLGTLWFAVRGKDE